MDLLLRLALGRTARGSNHDVYDDDDVPVLRVCFVAFYVELPSLLHITGHCTGQDNDKLLHGVSQKPFCGTDKHV